MSEPTPADVLRQAAEVIRTKGWCRGSLRAPEGQVCAMGAIYDAYARGEAHDHLKEECHEAADSAFVALLEVVGPLPGAVGGLHPVAIWNDQIATDAEDVAQHMEKAAALYEETAGLADSSSTAGAYPAAPPRL